MTQKIRQEITVAQLLHSAITRAITILLEAGKFPSNITANGIAINQPLLEF